MDRNIIYGVTKEDTLKLMNHNLGVMERAMLKTAKLSRSLKVFKMLSLGAIAYIAYKCRKQEEELYKLSIKVNKLENKEGE